MEFSTLGTVYVKPRRGYWAIKKKALRYPIVRLGYFGYTFLPAMKPNPEAVFLKEKILCKTGLTDKCAK